VSTLLHITEGLGLTAATARPLHGIRFVPISRGAGLREHRVLVTGACKHTVVMFRDFQHFQTAMLVLVKCSASGSEETIP